MDEDLQQLSIDQLIEEVKKLRAAIREHRDSTGKDLWWFSLLRLAVAKHLFKAPYWQAPQREHSTHLVLIFITIKHSLSHLQDHSALFLHRQITWMFLVGKKAHSQYRHNRVSLNAYLQ